MLYEEMSCVLIEHALLQLYHALAILQYSVHMKVKDSLDRGIWMQKVTADHEISF